MKNFSYNAPIITLVSLLLVANSLSGQIITTIAGNGIQANAGDGGAATAASFDYPTKIIFDKNGNYYLSLGANGNRIKRIDVSGVMSNYAGTGIAGFSGDGGPATAATFRGMQEIVFDSAYNMYIADTWNNRIRRIDKSTGIITTYAGTGVAGFSGDGNAATNAQLNSPQCLCFDKDQNMYVSDGVNYRIRKITPGGIITSIAGNGTAGVGLGANGVPATSVSINPVGILTANNMIYMADDHGRVFKINLSTGIISYFAGNGLGGHSGDGGPATAAGVRPNLIAMDKFGNLFIAESYFHRVRMVNTSGYIYTIAGTGTSGYSGDGGSATAAQLAFPAGIALDSCGNLYIPEKNNWVIRKVTFPKCNYLDVSETPVTTHIAIYPNPAGDILNVEGILPGTAYRLYNMSGAVVQQGTLAQSSNEVSLRSLPPGVYMIQLTAEDGTRTTQRVIKQ